MKDEESRGREIKTADKGIKKRAEGTQRADFSAIGRNRAVTAAMGLSTSARSLAGARAFAPDLSFAMGILGKSRAGEELLFDEPFLVFLEMQGEAEEGREELLELLLQLFQYRENGRTALLRQTERRRIEERIRYRLRLLREGSREKWEYTALYRDILRESRLRESLKDESRGEKERGTGAEETAYRLREEKLRKEAERETGAERAAYRLREEELRKEAERETVTERAAYRLREEKTWKEAEKESAAERTAYRLREEELRKEAERESAAERAAYRLREGELRKEAERKSAAERAAYRLREEKHGREHELEKGRGKAGEKLTWQAVEEVRRKEIEHLRESVSKRLEKEWETVRKEESRLPEGWKKRVGEQFQEAGQRRRWETPGLGTQAGKEGRAAERGQKPKQSRMTEGKGPQARGTGGSSGKEETAAGRLGQNSAQGWKEWAGRALLSQRAAVREEERRRKRMGISGMQKAEKQISAMFSSMEEREKQEFLELLEMSEMEFSCIEKMDRAQWREFSSRLSERLELALRKTAQESKGETGQSGKSAGKPSGGFETAAREETEDPQRPGAVLGRAESRGYEASPERANARRYEASPEHANARRYEASPEHANARGYEASPGQAESRGYEEVLERTASQEPVKSPETEPDEGEGLERWKERILGWARTASEKDWEKLLKGEAGKEPLPVESQAGNGTKAVFSEDSHREETGTAAGRKNREAFISLVEQAGQEEELSELVERIGETAGIPSELRFLERTGAERKGRAWASQGQFYENGTRPERAERGESRTEPEGGKKPEGRTEPEGNSELNQKERPEDSTAPALEEGRGKAGNQENMEPVKIPAHPGDEEYPWGDDRAGKERQGVLDAAFENNEGKEKKGKYLEQGQDDRRSFLEKEETDAAAALKRQWLFRLEEWFAILDPQEWEAVYETALRYPGAALLLRTGEEGEKERGEEEGQSRRERSREQEFIKQKRRMFRFAESLSTAEETAELIRYFQKEAQTELLCFGWLPTEQELYLKEKRGTEKGRRAGEESGTEEERNAEREGKPEKEREEARERRRFVKTETDGKEPEAEGLLEMRFRTEAENIQKLEAKRGGKAQGTETLHMQRSELLERWKARLVSWAENRPEEEWEKTSLIGKRFLDLSLENWKIRAARWIGALNEEEWSTVYRTALEHPELEIALAGTTEERNAYRSGVSPDENFGEEGQQTGDTSGLRQEIQNIQRTQNAQKEQMLRRIGRMDTKEEMYRFIHCFRQKKEISELGRDLFPEELETEENAKETWRQGKRNLAGQERQGKKEDEADAGGAFSEPQAFGKESRLPDSLRGQWIFRLEEWFSILDQEEWKTVYETAMDYPKTAMLLESVEKQGKNGDVCSRVGGETVGMLNAESSGKSHREEPPRRPRKAEETGRPAGSGNLQGEEMPRRSRKTGEEADFAKTAGAGRDSWEERKKLGSRENSYEDRNQTLKFMEQKQRMFRLVESLSTAEEAEELIRYFQNEKRTEFLCAGWLPEHTEIWLEHRRQKREESGKLQAHQSRQGSVNLPAARREPEKAEVHPGRSRQGSGNLPTVWREPEETGRLIKKDIPEGEGTAAGQRHPDADWTQSARGPEDAAGRLEGQVPEPENRPGSGKLEGLETLAAAQTERRQREVFIRAVERAESMGELEAVCSRLTVFPEGFSDIRRGLRLWAWKRELGRWIAGISQEEWEPVREVLNLYYGKEAATAGKAGNAAAVQQEEKRRRKREDSLRFHFQDTEGEGNEKAAFYTQLWTGIRTLREQKQRAEQGKQNWEQRREVSERILSRISTEGEMKSLASLLYLESGEWKRAGHFPVLTAQETEKLRELEDREALYSPVETLHTKPTAVLFNMRMALRESRRWKAEYGDGSGKTKPPGPAAESLAETPASEGRIEFSYTGPQENSYAGWPGGRRALWSRNRESGRKTNPGQTRRRPFGREAVSAVRRYGELNGLTKTETGPGPGGETVPKLGPFSWPGGFWKRASESEPLLSLKSAEMEGEEKTFYIPSVQPAFLKAAKTEGEEKTFYMPSVQSAFLKAAKTEGEEKSFYIPSVQPAFLKTAKTEGEEKSFYIPSVQPAFLKTAKTEGEERPLYMPFVQPVFLNEPVMEGLGTAVYPPARQALFPGLASGKKPGINLSAAFRPALRPFLGEGAKNRAGTWLNRLVLSGTKKAPEDSEAGAETVLAVSLKSKDASSGIFQYEPASLVVTRREPPPPKLNPPPPSVPDIVTAVKKTVEEAGGLGALAKSPGAAGPGGMGAGRGGVLGSPGRLGGRPGDDKEETFQSQLRALSEQVKIQTEELRKLREERKTLLRVTDVERLNETLIRQMERQLRLEKMRRGL